MGSNISRTASVERIHEVAKRTMAAAQARGGDVLGLAQTRIAPSILALDESEQQLLKAREADDALHAALLARDSESDLEVGSVCDEIWNALGRPSQSIDFDLIANGGKKVWCDGDPSRQPSLMAVLAKNIRTSKHPKLAEKKEAWAARIEQRAAAQAEAARPAEASYAQITSLGMQRRALADSVQVSLVRYKRDLKNQGMTEAQVHEIIPDASTGNGGTVHAAPASGPATQPAPKPAA